jgi:glucokinase-like ROK family protein
VNITHTVNSTQIRLVNRSAILELIRQKGPIARSVIGRQLGLSLPTVMRIIDELVKDDLVLPTGEMEGSGGRKRELLTLQQDKHVVIGVDLGGTKMYGAMANIGGEILREVNINGHGTSGEESFEMLVSMIQQLLEAPLNKGQVVNGIAIGAPGVTRSREGVVEWAPSLNWRDFPLKKRLGERFHYPIAVDNDVNLAVLGESWFGAGQGASNMVLIAIGTGVGSGIIIDGAVYRGYSEAAGEVGYMLPDCNSLNKRYEYFGALESIISGTGITQRARKYLQGKWTDEQLETLTAEDVFDAARRGEKWAKRVVADTVNYLSVAIANICTLLDPELVILGGGVSKSADLLIPPILQNIEGVIPKLPRIEPSKLGYQATVMGAIAITVYLTNNYYLLRNLS